MGVGLYKETPDGVLATLDEYAERNLPAERLLELDAKDEMPLDVIREMCGPQLGVHLLFIPEEFNGMGGGAFDVPDRSFMAKARRPPPIRSR